MISFWGFFCQQWIMCKLYLIASKWGCMLTTLSDDWLFQQNNLVNLIKTLASNLPKQIVEAINNSSRLLELFYFIYTCSFSKLVNLTRGVLVMEVWKHLHKLHADANDTGLILSLKKSSSICLSVCCPASKCYCFNERAKIWHLEWNSLICLMARAIVVIAWPRSSV